MRIRLPRPTRAQLELVWDVLMVWMALINLGMILFDLTYLWARPTYRGLVPPLVRLYDPVKGIAPQPLTEALLREAAEARRIADLDPAAPTVGARFATLAALTERALLEDPFERSGQSTSAAAFRRIVASESGVPTIDLVDPGRVREAVERFWSPDPAVVPARLDLFDRELRPLLAANYFREFDRSGELEDRFWMLDLPFLALFLSEFLVRWLLALRRRTYARWYFYPLFHWYDAIGVLPGAWFRLFRPLRLVSMYMRLRRSARSIIGQDAASRLVAYFSGIIAEEISDRVAVRILDELATEIREGTARRIARSTVLPRRAEIERLLAAELAALLTDPATLASLHELCRLNLERAVASSHAFDGVPLPGVVVRPLARSIGEVVLAATFEGVPRTMETAEGRGALERVLATAVGRLLAGPAPATLELLAREVSVEVIEEMKATVSVRKWALPDRPSGEVPAQAGPAPADAGTPASSRSI